MYRRLEVPPDASAQQIRWAYRRLAHGLHPDVHPEDPDASRRFQEITEAYEILGDPQRRARYDRSRHRSPISSGGRTGRSEEGTTPPMPAAPPRWGGEVRTRPPTLIGSFSIGTAPLTAGPVRIVPPPDADGAPPSRSSSNDLARFLDALLRSWRGW
jgi:curved DNA-binding protein CbpA